MAEFQGAATAEIRIYDNPADPTNSKFHVALPVSVLGAILDLRTGGSLAEILDADEAALFSHIANTYVHVTPEWVGNINAILAELVTFSQQDFLTEDERSRWDQAALDAAAALALALELAGTMTDVEGRLEQVENSLFSAITSNPFILTFGNLTGIIVARGVWNQTMHRVEC